MGLRKTKTEMSAVLEAVKLKGHPSVFDWRNNNGDILTSVKDRRDCGSSGARAILVLNGKELWPMSSMEPNVPKSLGYFENGDGLRFELKIDSGVRS
jgi:hypothetical protein